MLRLDDVLVVDYLEESVEQLATVEADLLAMEYNMANVDRQRISRLIRIMHNVRVGSSFIGLVKVGELSQQVENVLVLIKSGRLAPVAECITTLLHATDELIESLRNPLTSNQANTSELMIRLGQLCSDQQEPLRKRGAYPTNRGARLGTRLRILLVEDDFACRLLLQTFLSRYGECHVAINGKEAVEAFRTSLDKGGKYDLICMDIMMPELDGREAVTQIRDLEQVNGIQSTYGTKIFMTTSVGEIREVFRCFRELCDAYLLKPIDLGQLLSQMKLYQLIDLGDVSKSQADGASSIWL